MNKHSLKIFTFNQNSRFYKNLFNVAKANLFIQATGLLIAPLLSRLYSPTAFGTAAIFTSILSLFLAISTWRCEWSIPNTKSKTEATALIILSLLSAFIITIFSHLAITLLSLDAFLWINLHQIHHLLNLIPIAIIGNSLHQVLQSWYIREANLTVVSHTRMIQSASNTSLGLIGGFLKTEAFGLVCSNVISSWLGLSLLLKKASGLKTAYRRLTPKRILIVYRRFIGETTLSTAASLINTISLNLPPLFIAYQYSSTEVGWYALMQRVALSPLSIITGAISQSFWAEAAQLVNKQSMQLRRLYLQSTLRLLLAALPIAFICLCGPLYIGLIFGSQWSQAGNILASLSPLIIGQITVQPLSHLVVHRKQIWQFWWDLCRTTLIITIMVLSHTVNLKIDGTMWLISTTSLFMYIIMFFLNLICFKEKP